MEIIERRIQRVTDREKKERKKRNLQKGEICKNNKKRKNAIYC